MKNAALKTIGRLSLFVFASASIAAFATSKISVEINAVIGNYTFDLDEYYAALTEQSGNALLGQVHDLMASTHSTYTSYEDCKNGAYVYRTDPGDDEDHIRDFYTQAGDTLSSSWEGGSNKGTWNREHVWPKSNSNGIWKNSNDGAGSDIHHIRPEEYQLNADRGNLRFGEVPNRESHKVYAKNKKGENITDYVGGYINGAFEPIDSCKGNIARIVLYVYVHYNSAANVFGTTNGKGSSTYFGTLPITNIIYTAEDTNDSCFSLLLKWMEDDPVDDIERTRNEAASAMTGTRNVFIDHPELADCIWGDAIWGESGEEESSSSEVISSEEEESSEESSTEESSSEEIYSEDESSSEESSEESRSSEEQTSAESSQGSSSEEISSEQSSEASSTQEESQSSESKSDSSTKESQSESGSKQSSEEGKKGGCGGSIAAGSVAIAITLAFASALLIKRRK